MSYYLIVGAILLTSSVMANVNISCYECKGCQTTPTSMSTNNQLCFRIQINCSVVKVHVIDLMGDRLHSNYSSLNCGQTQSYSSACIIAYQCCYTDKCNTYESHAQLSTSTTSSSLSSSSSSLLYIVNSTVVIIFSILFMCRHFL